MKPYWLTNGFLSAPADDFGAGGGGENDEIDELEPDLGDEDEGEDDDSPPDNKGFDVARLGQEFADRLAPHLQQRGQQQQQSSEDILQAHLSKLQVSEDVAAMLSDPEIPVAKRAQALQKLIHDAVTHSVQFTGLAMNGFAGQINPAIAELRAAQANQRVDDFAKSVVGAYPALKGKNKLVKEAYLQLGREGYSTSSKREAFRAVAQRVQKLAKMAGAELSLKNPNKGNTTMPPRGQSGPSRQVQQQGGRKNLFSAHFGPPK